jgi:hypothetical protein
MSKRPNLAAVAAAAGSTRRTIEPEPVIPPPDAAAPSRAVRTRIATKQIAGHFPDDVAWQLRAIALERRTTVQNLLAEALNDLFAKHGKPELAPVNSPTR